MATLTSSLAQFEVNALKLPGGGWGVISGMIHILIYTLNYCNLVLFMCLCDFINRAACGCVGSCCQSPDNRGTV